MSKLINVDFLFERMSKAISSFYDRYYFGRDKEHRKEVHLTQLREEYTTRHFSNNPIILEKEIKIFLTSVQGKVDEYIF